MDRYTPFAGNDGLGYCDTDPEGEYVKYADVEELVIQTRAAAGMMKRIAAQIETGSSRLRLASACLRLRAATLLKLANVKPQP